MIRLIMARKDVTFVMTGNREVSIEEETLRHLQKIWGGISELVHWPLIKKILTLLRNIIMLQTVGEMEQWC